MTEPILQARPVPAAHAKKLAAAGVPEPLASLFAARGVTDLDEVACGLESLPPTSAMKGCDEMATVLANAAAARERVLIISDYDCDGATACSVLITAFKGAGMNFDYLVPDRMIHGYGLTPSIVDEAAALVPKPRWIITVDNGISSTAGVDRAREHGIEVLITDHHLAPEVLPDAHLIVNPNQPGCTFPSKNIAGCGVAWFVARALHAELRERGVRPAYDPDDLLPFVALGTIADIVKLDRYNRVIVREGLERIRAARCTPGITTLAAVAKRELSRLSCMDVGFGLGPRINAAGRLAHMGAGIDCLTTTDATRAVVLAQELDAINNERKEIQKAMGEQAIAQVETTVANSLAACDTLPMSIVVRDDSWHEGVIGVVAGRIKETYHRPTIVMCTDGHDGVKGSGRSIPGFHLKHALDEINVAHPGILRKFGGHAMAAGMTIDATRFDDFKKALEAVCDRHLAAQPELLEKVITHDGALDPQYMTLEIIEALNMEVWGQGFETPAFVDDFKVTGFKVMGEDKEHVKLSVVKANGEGGAMDMLAFGRADLVAGGGFDGILPVVYKPQINVFRENVSLQLLADYIPPTEALLLRAAPLAGASIAPVAPIAAQPAPATTPGRCRIFAQDDTDGDADTPATTTAASDPAFSPITNPHRSRVGLRSPR